MKPFYKVLVASISLIVILLSSAYGSRKQKGIETDEIYNSNKTKNKNKKTINTRTGLPIFIHNIITPDA
jgi:predicted HAD superfamily Cof-like phosphohydrolase